MNDITLNEAQEQQLLDFWNKTPDNPPRLKELTQHIFGHECDSRSAEGRAVKQTLAKHNIRAKTERDPEREIELSEAHKLYITNNARTMSALEMARVIFSNPMLTALHGETRAVQAFMNTLQPVIMFSPNANNDVPTEPYKPPKNIEDAMERVNHYINFCIDKNKITPQQKKCLNTLIGYLHTYRFVAQMNNYTTMKDRFLCEDAFIRATWDKPDLAQEEIDQYIEYSNQVVNGFLVQRRSNQLQGQLEEITEAQSTDGSDNIKISMSLVEAIGKASTEYHQCLARQQKLLDDLKEKRSSRLSKQVKDNASILNLVQMWKAEETRLELLQHAEREQAAVAKEVDKLTSMDELKARILGLTKEEILNG